MIIELNGKIEQAKFNKVELDAIFTRGNVTDRKFLRNQSLGHTVGTYTGWSHVKAETGYSIWKFAPTNYAHNSSNQLYLNNQLLTLMGSASAESASAFDAVYLYNDLAYTNNTTEASTENGTEFSLMSATDEYLYIGNATKFGGIKFEFQTRGSGYNLEIEYYNGSTWAELTGSGNTLVDNTSNFESDGLITFDQPADWNFTTVNGAYKYWLRIRTSSSIVTTAKAYYIIPGNTVPGLLALSSSEIINGSWKWVYYSSNVYVTIRNAGAASQEGNYYITSSSSAINLQNFFIYNNEISADYEDSTYVP
jgi:hypothetical protein